MSHDPAPDTASVVAAERSLLQALCQEDDEGGTSPNIRQALRGYRFRDPAHEVAYEAIERIRSRGFGVNRERLQREFVLAGFPGLDAADFFLSRPVSRSEALALLAGLAAPDAPR